MESATVEGISIPALSSAQDWHHQGNPSGFPGTPPFVRGRHAGKNRNGWRIGHMVNQPNIQAAAKALKNGLQGGATAIFLELDAKTRADFGSLDTLGDQPLTGVPIQNLYGLEALLGKLQPNTPIMLQSGWAFFAHAALLGAYWEKNNIAPEQRLGCFGVDPLGACVRWGMVNPELLNAALIQMGDLMHWSLLHCPKVSTVCINLQPHHNAGGGEAQEIGFALACGLEYLRYLETSAHLPLEQALQSFTFCFALHQEPLLNVAKLRGARLAWAQMLDVCKVLPRAQGMRQYAFSSQRMLTQKDPWMNLLRLTAAGFAASIGGVETLFLHPFDALYGNGSGSEFSQRMSRNLQIMLREESQMHAVLDPAGGSWSLESLTNRFAERGWEVFQAIENQGGARAVLESGWWVAQIASVREKRQARIEAAQQRIIGVNMFPLLDETPPPSAEDDTPKLPTQKAPTPVQDNALQGALEALAGGHATRRKSLGPGLLSKMVQATQAAIKGASLQQLHQAIMDTTSIGNALEDKRHPIAGLPNWREASAYEALRNACDSADLQQQRPTAVLVCLGHIADSLAAQSHTKNVLGSGGIAVQTLIVTQLQRGVHDFKHQNASIAVLCGHDENIPYPQLAKALRGAGARYVLLHQAPSPHTTALLPTQHQATPIDALLYEGCTPYPLLKQILTTLHIFPPSKPFKTGS